MSFIYSPYYPNPVFDSIVTKEPELNVLYYNAKGDGSTDDSAAFQAAIDACPTGGTVFVPSTTTSYRVANLDIHKPIKFRGEGLGSKLQAVAAATGYILLIDGAAAGNVSRADLGFDGGAHTCNVVIKDLFLEGNARGAAIGGIYLNMADWGTYQNLWIHNFAKEAINCYSGLRESVFDNINIRWCGDGVTYPGINLKDQAAVTAESHNNLIFRAIYSIYTVGDHVWMDTLNGKGLNVRHIRFENCMFHGLVVGLDGAGNNPFDMTFGAAQKAFKMFDIGTAEDISITNSLFSTLGEAATGINIVTGANGDPARIRISNNRFTSRYDTSAVAADITIHLQDGTLMLSDNVIATTGGDSINIKTDVGSNLYNDANLITGTGAIAGGVNMGYTSNLEINWQDADFKNLDGVVIGTNSTASSHNADLSCFDTGVINLKETATPAANAGSGKIYTKDTDKLYFQDGGGVEHEIALVP